jgi:putative transposase
MVVGTGSRYSKNAGAVFSLKYHIVWCPKYRLKVLVGDVETRLKNVLLSVAAQYGVLIEVMEVMPDHVHLFVSADPTRCVAEIVNRLKGASSPILRNEFPRLKSRMPTLWSRSYYAGTVGHVSEAAVKKYIENQEER